MEAGHCLQTRNDEEGILGRIKDACARSAIVEVSATLVRDALVAPPEIPGRRYVASARWVSEMPRWFFGTEDGAPGYYVDEAGKDGVPYSAYACDQVLATADVARAVAAAEEKHALA